MKQETLKRLHEVEVEILDEIVRICEKFSLKYYIIGGTLLGAVRHKGFIPWDDDLDIVMPREDYDKFCDICKTELDDKYFLHNLNSDDKYWLIHAKVRKRNTLFEENMISTIDGDNKGIFVDIFPLDDAKEADSRKQRRATFVIKGLSRIILRKSGVNRNFKKSVKLASFLLPFSIKRLSKWQLRRMTKGNGKGYEYYINYGSSYNTVKQTMLKSVYGTPCKLEFEGKFYNAPSDYKYYLERIYGENYMELPPLEKRITHNPVRMSFDTDGLDETLEE